MSLPNWPGASHCYTRAAALCKSWCQDAYDKQRKAYHRKTGFRFTPPGAACDLALAMDRGDEEYIKGTIMAHDMRANLPPLAKSSR